MSPSLGTCPSHQNFSQLLENLLVSSLARRANRDIDLVLERVALASLSRRELNQAFALLLR